MKKEYNVPFISVFDCPAENLANVTFDGSVGSDNAIPMPGGSADDQW